jgi:hypothetical protein
LQPLATDKFQAWQSRHLSPLLKFKEAA